MSVVVWDGKTLAADRQAVNADLRFLARKIRRLADGTIVAWTGHPQVGMALAKWYESGADPEKLPPAQSGEDWSRLIVISPQGKAVTFERYGEPMEVFEPFAAWGSGRDYALGALAMGADARRAVEIVNQFCITCGGGVEAFDVLCR